MAAKGISAGDEITRWKIEYRGEETRPGLLKPN